jgi:hypothetical protein
MEIADYSQGILLRRLRNQPGHGAAVADQHNLLLVALDGVQHGIEIARDVRD